MSEDKTRFVEAILANPINAVILERMPLLNLSDCWLVSGGLFQTVWNVQTDRAPTYGIKDYDLFYFDSSDLSWEAEDVVIKTCDETFQDLHAEIQIRNQARVHLWYEEKFGAPYPKLKSSCDGIDHFVSPSNMYGIRSGTEGGFDVYAPFGFDDAFDLVARPNPDSAMIAHVYEKKTARWKNLWPELTVIPFTQSEPLKKPLSPE